MRNPSGYGGIKKLAGKRRRPYAVTVTTKYEMTSTRKDISFLQEYLDPELYNQVAQQYAERCPDTPKAKQKQQIIGYYETRPEAMIALAEYNKNPYDIDKRNTTFKQVCDILYDTQFSKMGKSSKGAYVTSINKCEKIHNIRMPELKSAHMQAVIDDYIDQSKPAQQKLITLFKSVYAFCLKNDIVVKDYSAYLEVTTERETEKKTPFTQKEVAAVWNCQDWRKSPSNRKQSRLDGIYLCDTVLIMLYSGVRIGELLDVKFEDVHIDEKWIDLRGTKTKAARRIVPIHDKIIPLLEARLADCSEGKHLFRANDGSRITVNAYEAQFFYPYCEHIEIYKHKPHECRHSFATFADLCNFDEFYLKRILGHKMGDITKDTYTHTFITKLLEEVNKLDYTKE